MITVTVRYYNALRRRAAVERETISLLCGTSLHTALEQLAERHDSRLREMLLAPQGGLASHLVVFRNRQLLRPDQHDDLLADGDELMLFPAVSGG